MVTFTALVEILSLENYYNTKVAGFGENVIPRKFSAMQYLRTYLGTFMNNNGSREARKLRHRLPHYYPIITKESNAHA